eukprot:677328-Amphidinium_carterae.1
MLFNHESPFVRHITAGALIDTWATLRRAHRWAVEPVLIGHAVLWHNRSGPLSGHSARTILTASISPQDLSQQLLFSVFIVRASSALSSDLA